MAHALVEEEGRITRPEQPSPQSGGIGLVWFRRDLRDFDHAALSAAVLAERQVHCVFVFDTEILDALPSREDRRVEFIWLSVIELDQALRRQEGGLWVLHGRARDEVPQLAARLGVTAVYASRDYEPLARERDAEVARSLAAQGTAFLTFKDQVILEPGECLTQQGRPYIVFTPYKRAWLARLGERELPVHAGPPATALVRPPASDIPTLAQLGFRHTNLVDLKMPVGMSGGRALTEAFMHHLAHYAQTRDFPAVRGVSYLSVHLRFGTVSIRQLVSLARAAANDGADTWLSELVWREFYFQILWHFPEVVRRPFQLQYEAIRYPGQEQHFAAWCRGLTGYPLVDAGMRQLNHSGYMHNRLRMITASFLVKDLLIDWRRGEGYFAEKLNDFDLAANNGGWQWCASTGCDAQPYFRIFNPVTQSEKFDPAGKFIRLYVPELAKVPDQWIHAPWRMDAATQAACGVRMGRDYPLPLVDHAAARLVATRMYADARTPMPSPAA